MAVTASGLFGVTLLACLKNTSAIDITSSPKVAMFTNSITPNFDTDTAYGAAPYNANEVSGTGYSAGGTSLGSPTAAVSSGTIVYDASDTSWATSTISSARCALIYTNTGGTKDAIVLVNFGADYSTTAGTFTIVWNASGIFVVDYTP